MAVVLAAEPGSIETAVQALRSGGVIIFPTETVYGIGADIRCPAAVRRVYALKRRPEGMALLAHCGDESQLDRLVAAVPDAARLLMRRFWPGPLALVFERGVAAEAAATAGGRTVGVRMTSCAFAAAVCRRLGAAVAGTSANRHRLPASAKFAELDPALLAEVELAVDAGECGSGRGSTIVDVTSEPPRLIRAGGVAAAEIEAALGRPLARGR